MKIKDIVKEDTRIRDPYAYDYERDPETGEYTYRTTADKGPGMFSRMLQKHTGDVPSFMPTDEPVTKDQRISRIKVPQGKRLVTTTRDGRQYFKYPAGPQDADKSGRWTDSANRSIVSSTSVAALERLAKQNGQLEDLAAQPAAQPAAQTEPTTEPQNIIVPDPSRRRTEPAAAEPEPTEPIPVEPEEPLSLVDQPLSGDERIAVDTPAGTFYKYSDGNWYQIPTTGVPVRAQFKDYETLDRYADAEGYVEKIPPTPKKRGRK